MSKKIADNKSLNAAVKTVVKTAVKTAVKSSKVTVAAKKPVAAAKAQVKI